MKIKMILLIMLALLLSVSTAYANNVAVSNVVLHNKNLVQGTIDIRFNLSQDNTFSGTDANNQEFYDSIWLFVKYWVEDVNSEATGWYHATLTTGGTITPTSDNKGAFAQTGDNQTLRWHYSANGIGNDDTIKVRVCAIEMVYIPEGAFVYNAGAIGGSLFNNYGAGAQAIVSSADHIPAGAAAGWPNGYNGFYIAKYEVSQAQYADFLNMLSETAANTRFPNTTANRQTITHTAENPYGSRYTAGSPNRAMNQTSWDDLRAYSSWAALRPLTEMEFEKAARGGGAGNNITYPWGSNNPTTITYVFDEATISRHYACFNNTSNGPVNVGHYLSGDITRSNEQTGASFYGVTDLAGNNWEHIINCAHPQVPSNGDGTISWPASWPDAPSGKGFRGGSWINGSGSLRVSDRNSAGGTDAGRTTVFGSRPCRTSP